MSNEYPLIDQRFLTENWAPEEDPELLAEAVAIFRTDSYDVIDAITQATQAGNALKGGAGNLGAVRLAKLCDVIEGSARNGQLPSAAQLQSLTEILGQTVKVLDP
jgi:HPt (histidine-containing phosphotransfer) domain-containing protein